MQLGNHTYAFPVCLAPMAGYTDATFRALCREYGADIVVTEMISAKGLYYGSDRTQALLPADGPYPVAVQLFGSDEAIVPEMAARVADALGPRLLAIDLTMGCPAPKITNNGDGCALMRTPLLAARIIESTARRISAPVTVKFRKGWSEKENTAVAFARLCEESGAAAVTVHPRSRERMYAGRADWETIAAVKRAVRSPVIGNGDVETGADALRMRAETGVDGVMLGRAALGNPFVFAEVRAALAGAAYTPPTAQQRRALALRHAELALSEKGEHALIELRKHLAWYVRGVPGAVQLRMRVNEAATLDELREILT